MCGLDPENKYFKMDLVASGDVGSLFVRELDDSTSYTIGGLWDYPALTCLSVNLEVILTEDEPIMHLPNKPFLRLIDMLPPESGVPLPLQLQKGGGQQGGRLRRRAYGKQGRAASEAEGGCRGG